MILTSSNGTEKWTESELNEIFRKQELVDIEIASQAMAFQRLVKQNNVNKEYTDRIYKEEKILLFCPLLFSAPLMKLMLMCKQ